MAASVPPMIAEAAAERRAQLRAAKQERLRREAAEKRRAKLGLVSAEEAASLVDNSTLQGSGLAKHGNFHSYYSFNKVEERTQHLPHDLALTLARAVNTVMLVTATEGDSESVSPLLSAIDPTILRTALPPNCRRSLVMLDIGCNEGDLTESIVHTLRAQCDDSANAGDEPVYIGALGCDIDNELIQRANAKFHHPDPSTAVSYLTADVTHFDLFTALTSYLPPQYKDRRYDLVSLHAVLMWLHLNHGSAFLSRWLATLASLTNSLIIEYQPQRHYKSACHRLRHSGVAVESVWKWSEIGKDWRGTANVRRQVTSILSECGLVERQELGITAWIARSCSTRERA